jgi:phage shock protein PspC (stress-responsive transcriptional regulator)
LIEHSRLLVQSEETRFVAAQSRATTLLAVSGVLAGIGVTLASRFGDRHFPWPWHPFGVSLSLGAVIVVILTLFTAVALIWASAIALGAMQQEIELNFSPAFQNALIGEQFPEMLETAGNLSSRTVLGLLAELHQGAQRANREINQALWRCGVWLGLSVATGLLLSAFVLGATSAPAHLNL